MTKSRGILGPRKRWTPAEDKLFRRIYARKHNSEIAHLFGCSVTAVNARSTTLGVHKDPAWVHAVNMANGQRLTRDGLANRFPKGHIPVNKGLRRPGWYRGRMRETQFQKGMLNGQALRNYKPIGSLSLSKEGYVIRKMREPGGGYRGAQCWRQEHILIWEKVNGPVPPRHRLAFRDGDKKHITLDNLELVTYAEMMRRNTIHARRSPAEKAAIYALIALKSKITKMEKKQQTCQTTSRKSEKSFSTRSGESQPRTIQCRSTAQKPSAASRKQSSTPPQPKSARGTRRTSRKASDSSNAKSFRRRVKSFRRQSG